MATQQVSVLALQHIVPSSAGPCPVLSGFGLYQVSGNEYGLCMDLLYFEVLHKTPIRCSSSKDNQLQSVAAVQRISKVLELWC